MFIAQSTQDQLHMHESQTYGYIWCVSVLSLASMFLTLLLLFSIGIHATRRSINKERKRSI